MKKSFLEFLGEKGLGDEKGSQGFEPTPTSSLMSDDDTIETFKTLLFNIAADKNAYRDVLHFLNQKKDYSDIINELIDILPKESTARMRFAAKKMLERKVQADDLPKARKEMDHEIIPNAADSPPNQEN